MLYTSRNLVAFLLLALPIPLFAEVTLPSIFSDHMVLQRAQENPVWGTAEAGEQIRVAIGGQLHETITDSDGRWRVKLAPLPVGGPYELEVVGSNGLIFKDVMVGEVWICSGQSNMQWSLSRSNNGALYALAAQNAQIRLITVPKLGTQEPQESFDAGWALSTPEIAEDFSAIGYYYGLRLQETLGVPVGLIDNSWGGSAAEAWVPLDYLKTAGNYDEMIANANEQAAAYTDEIHTERIAAYRAWEFAGKPKPSMSWPVDPRTGNRRPANLYNGVLYPTGGYGIRGVIWYQGETNSGRGYQYRDLFPLVIRSWRELWGQGDFSFYWVQLPAYRDEKLSNGDSHWAELREAQTMALDLPNTAEVVTLDLGEGRDIHPREKLTIANRLARIALSLDYGYDIAYQNPRFSSMTIEDGSILITFDHVSDGGLRAFDTTELVGFSVAGEDRSFVSAKATIVGDNQVKIWSPDVQVPVAVRYAWADNPNANLQDRNGLPAASFRTDDWPGVSAPKVSE